MAWADTLLPASFKGIAFEVESVNRSNARSLAVHELPFKDGASVDDLGRRARRHQVRAIFWGRDYERRLQALLKALDAGGVGTLVHPVWGNVEAVASDWTDEHDADLVDGAKLNLSFVEHTSTTVFAERTFASQADTVNVASATARAAADDAVVRRVLAMPALNFTRVAVVRDLMAQARSQARTLLNTTGVRVLLSDLDPVLNPRAYVGDLRAIVTGALSGLSFGGLNLAFGSAGVPLPQASTALGDWQVARRQLDPSTVALVPAANVVDPDVPQDAAVLQAHAQVHNATALADTAALLLGGQIEQPTLDRADIEAVAGQARAALQAAIDAARAAMDAEARGQVADALRGAADAVQESARAVINQRPPLVRVVAPSGGAARLLAHRLYGDATRAPELARLNRLGRKVLIDLGDPLDVYAR